jgi:hypothetical protein
MRRLSHKKRGPPATGKGEPILVRLQPIPLADLDAWIARQHDQLSRPEAIRRLLEFALAGSRPPKARSAKARSKALDLAGKEIDKLSDQSASDEERQQRKRRLLKGPREFWDMRDEIRSKSKS